MSVKTVFVMRHGQTDNNVKGIIDGQNDSSRLTELGMQQVAQTANRILESRVKIDTIFTSDLTRTHDTAEIVRAILGKKIRIVPTPDLREIGMGNKEGAKMPPQLVASAAAWLARGINIPFSRGGESTLEVSERIEQFMNKTLFKQYLGERALIVTHQWPMSLLGSPLNKAEGGVAGPTHIKNAELWAFDMTAGQPMLVDSFRPSQE